MPLKEYIDKAKQILDKNWTGEYTVPSVHLYPHQWNWDSGFIAIGYSRYNFERAVKELTSLFNAQWKNGMLPHIVFNQKNLGKYFPEPDFWQAEKSGLVPEGFMTSGITQPPIHGYAALKIYENAPDKEKAKEFLKWIYPKLIKLHMYFYLERNPDDNGLIYIRHPWESGMDNSPMWDSVLEKIDLSKVKVPYFERKDNKIIDPEHRPRDEDYYRYIYLVDLFRRNNYQEEKIFKECPFIVFDPMFNSILAASNEALVKIADIIGEDYKKPEEWYYMTTKAVRDNLFSNEKNIFFAYDYIDKKLIEVETAAGFVPLFGGVASTHQALRLFHHINSLNFCQIGEKNCFAIPNYDKTKKDFKSNNYWRGPIWININWLIYHGLKRYGFKQKAEHLEKTILELPIRFGFYEYFDCFKGTGYGTKDFSWSAALFIDLIYDAFKEKPKSKRKLNQTLLMNTNGNTVLVEDTPQLMQDFSYFFKKIISQYARKGSVDYKKIQLSPEYKILQSVVSKFNHKDVVNYTNGNSQKAFLINLYNFMVIDFVIKMKIQHSVKEMDGFFTKLKYKIGGREYSLDDIKAKLFEFGDKRVPFALVKGTASSSALRFVDSNHIEKILDQIAADFVNSPKVIVVPEKQTVLISEFFKWNEDYFSTDKDIFDFIAKYITDDKKREFLQNNQNIKIRYISYDWNLNRD